MAPARGDELFGFVGEYVALGDHRSGTAVDRATVEWMAGRLERLGLSVRAEAVPFDRWVAESRLTGNGVDVAHLPLADGWTGAIDDPLRAARARGATAVVLATEHPNGALVAEHGGSGRPFVLTTPMNGWFGCAGERGTGIAVPLHVAAHFVAARPDLPVRVLVTGGHELTYFGAHAYVGAHPEPPAAVVHVGASVAVEERA